MELVRTTIEQYEKLKLLGFPINTTSKNPTPTIAFVLKWLRDEKKVIMFCHRYDDEDGGYVWEMRVEVEPDYHEDECDGICMSYEDMESDFLDHALDYLIDKKSNAL